MKADQVLEPGQPRTAGRREWAGVAVLAFGALFINFDLTVLYIALPEITADLGPSATQQLWIVDIYGFMVAGLLITMGALGDRIGRRKVLVIGSSLFGVASLAAAFSQSSEMLIASRVLLGIGAATFAPSSLALLRNMFHDPTERTKAVGIWMAAFMGGSVLGPVFGGAILHFFWWGAVFLPALVVMTLVVVVGSRVIPEYRDPAGGRLDVPSTVLSLAGILPLVWGIKQAAADGWQTDHLIAMAIGIGLLILFLIRQVKVEHPLVDVSLFRNRIFSGAFLLSFLGGLIMGGALLLVNLYLQTVQGFSPLKSGLVLAPTAFSLLMGIGLAQGLSRKFTPAYVIAGGLMTSAIGFAWVSQVSPGSSTWIFLIGWAVAFGGMGPAVALGYDMILSAAPPEKAGSASGTVEAFGQMGSALGVALIGSMSARVYRDQIELPEELPGSVVPHVRDSITQAYTILDGRTDPISIEALAQARDAFSTSFAAVSWLSAGLFALLAVFAAVVLRTYRPEDSVTTQDQPTQAHPTHKE